MNLTQQQFEDRVRVRAGNPSTVDVPPAVITEAVTAALLEYSKYRGPKKFVILQTVENQQEYEIPAEFITVDDVVWGDDVDVRGDVFLQREVFDPFEQILGLDAFKNPSLLNIVYQQLEDFRSQFEGVWDVVDSPTGGAMAVRLSPPPSSSQTMAVFGKLASTIANVPERDTEILMSACLWKLNDIRAIGSSSIESASFGGGSLSFGTKNFVEAQKRYEDRFLAAIGAGGPSFMKG